MRTWAVILLLLLLTQAYSIPLYAQTAETQTPVFRLDVRVVLVEAQVLSKKTRRAVRELKPEDFQLFEDDVPQRLSSFSQDTLPLSVVSFLTLRTA